MAPSKYIPFKETNAICDDPKALGARFIEDGYLFIRGLLKKERLEKIRDNIIKELKRHGFVESQATSEPTWTGKWPESDELSPDGIINETIVEQGILGELAVPEELIEVLESVLGGEVFAWKDSKGRLRLMLSDKMSYEGAAGGPKFSFSTPGHQDFYFFRPVMFCGTWIPLMDIDKTTGV